MELIKKMPQFILGLVVLLAFGCGKDDDDSKPVLDPVANQRCQLTEMKHTYSGGDVAVTVYTYNAAKQIIRTALIVNGTEKSSSVPEYNKDGKISKVTYLSNNDTSYNTYEYNNNKQIIKNNSFSDIDGQGSASISYNGYILYDYNSAKKRIKWSFYNAQNNALISYSNYTYPSPATIERQGYSVSSSGAVTHENTSNYTFDDKIAPETLLHGLSGHDLISENNLLSLNTTGSSAEKISYTYQYTPDGLPISRNYNNGALITTYTYNCQ